MNRKMQEMFSIRQRQERWLSECLNRNAKSNYAKRYGFEQIKSVEAYQKQVPLVTYEDIAELIQCSAKGEEDVLFAGKPVAFEMTGGSTGGSKLIPYTKESFADIQQALVPWFEETIKRYGIDIYKAYWSISPALCRPQKTQGGIRIGVSDAEYLGQEQSEVLDMMAVVPSWVGKLEGIDAWQTATLYWLIRADTLELISVWSPTFIVRLLDTIETSKKVLLTLFAEGGEVSGHLLEADKGAFERLECYLKEKKSEILWPNLKLISCWKDASSKPFAKQLQERFPYTVIQPKGLISTEGVVTVPHKNGEPLLSLNSGFYEFLDSEGNAFLADEMILGEHYEVVMTTSGGLYRYRSGDLVVYEGKNEGTPIVRFIGRRGVVSDMVGEKLTDAFVQQALSSIEGFSMLVANAAEIPHYYVVRECADIALSVTSIEAKLQENPQYAYARNMGQLGKLEVIVQKDMMSLYIDYKTALGSRVGDIKFPSLQTDKAWLQMIKKEQR